MIGASCCHDVAAAADVETLKLVGRGPPDFIVFVAGGHERRLEVVVGVRWACVRQWSSGLWSKNGLILENN